MTKIYANYSTGSQISISNYEYSELGAVDLIMFTACCTGLTNSTYGNLVDKALSKGAFCAIGWKETINTAGANPWVEQFFKRASERGTALGALQAADNWLELNGANYAPALRNRYIGTSNLNALNLAG